MSSLERQIRTIIEDLAIGSREPVGVALSGGLDSTVLLTVLVRLSYFEHITAFYVCHNLRPRDELKKENPSFHAICAAYHVPLTVITIRPGSIAAYAKEKKIGIEAAARHFRYHGLITAAAKKILLRFLLRITQMISEKLFFCDLCAEEASKAFQVCRWCVS